MSNIKKAVLLSLAFLLVSPVIYFCYEVYFADHTIHYESCGGVVPVSVPFSIAQKEASLSCGFEIKDEDHYTIYVAYLRQNGQKLPNPDELNALGEKIALEYALYDSKGNLIVPITSTVGDISIYDARGYLAKFFTTRFSPGKYKLEIKSLNAVPEMGNIRTDILITKSINVIN